jgi:hypothetical protein
MQLDRNYSTCSKAAQRLGHAIEHDPEIDSIATGSDSTARAASEAPELNEISSFPRRYRLVAEIGHHDAFSIESRLTRRIQPVASQRRQYDCI